MSKSRKNQKIIDDYDYLSNAASSGDCTGLIPAPPQNEAELESYCDLYQYLPPAAAKKDFDSSQIHSDK